MKKEKNIKSEIDLKNYQDLNGLTLKKMNFGLWLSENRRRILKILVILLITISAFFFIYSSYQYIIYFLTGQQDVNLLGSQLTYPRKPWEDLKISPVKVLAGGERADFIVQLENINSQFSASFNYCFVQGDNQELACGGDFILPGQKKFILVLGQTPPASGAAVTFKIKDIFWPRLNLHNIPDYPNFAKERLDFAVQNLTFANSSRSGLSDKVLLNNLKFDIVNQSPYSYYEVPLNILLYSGSEVVGVQKYQLSNFLAGEERHIDISWSGSLPLITKTEVEANLNILDNAIYLKYQGSRQ